MASVNKVILIGNLGRDPETRYLPSGDAVTNISIATSEKWKDKGGEQQEHTEWHRIAFFGKLAEIAGEYLKKGSPAISARGASAPASGRTRKAGRTSIRPRSWLTACNCWAAAVAAAAAARNRWRASRPRPGLRPRPAAVAANRSRVRRAAVRSTRWTTIFRFDGVTSDR